MKLVAEIRNGGHPILTPRATIDFFGYSIGAFLAQIILFYYSGNADARSDWGLDQSRAVLFCGGSTLAGMRPVSRHIIDSVAAETVRRYYSENFETEYREDTPISAMFEPNQGLGEVFVSMIAPE